MANRLNINYSLVAKAIESIKQNSRILSNDILLAKALGVSFTQLDGAFNEWAGVGVREFIRCLSLDRGVKNTLNPFSVPTLFNGAHSSYFSKEGDKNEQYVKIEELSVTDLKAGKDFSIHFSYQASLFGEVLIANTPKGICYLGFADIRESAFEELIKRFPNASIIEKEDALQKSALCFINQRSRSTLTIDLHLQGTDFQRSVWCSLLKIPLGKLTTYLEVSKIIKKPNASRAVGTAIGSNPIAFIIPCHRVVQSTGGLGGYRWGTNRKMALIGWEASQLK